LIQTMGRAARHQEGLVILYADKLSLAMQTAINETQRRRQFQIKFNKTYKITPESIIKPIREKLLKGDLKKQKKSKNKKVQVQPLIIKVSAKESIDLTALQPNALTPQDKRRLTKQLTKRMRRAAKDMDFELAAILRDKIQAINV